MNKDDLKVVWICDNCKILLIFYDDCKVHCQKTGHVHLTAYDIETGKMLKNKGISVDSGQQSSWMHGAVA
jgi:hypothetical protein